MNQWFFSISCCDRMQKLVLKKFFLNKINAPVKEIIKKYFVIFHVNILKTVTIGDATLTPHEITWHQLAIVYAFIHLYLQHTHFLYLYLSSIFYFSNYCISLTNNKRGEKKIFYENRLTKFSIDTFIMIEEIVRSDAERERDTEKSTILLNLVSLHSIYTSCEGNDMKHTYVSCVATSQTV